MAEVLVISAKGRTFFRRYQKQREDCHKMNFFPNGEHLWNLFVECLISLLILSPLNFVRLVRRPHQNMNRDPHRDAKPNPTEGTCPAWGLPQRV